MSKVKLHKGDNGDHWELRCPGCEETHVVGPTWGFNGDVEKPTFTPSLLVRSGHYCDTGVHDHPCWCDYNAERRARGEAESGHSCQICHSFITDGRIQFLGDSTHALAGQTVELPDMQ